jgi:integrase/recombinase XerD
LCDPPTASTAELSVVRLPRMLRHTFVTTMQDTGVDLRDVQTLLVMPTRAPRCATTGRKNLDRHPNYILAAYTASGT